MKKSFTLILLTLCSVVMGQSFRITDMRLGYEKDYKPTSHHPSNQYSIEIQGDSAIKIIGEDKIKSLYVYDVDKSDSMSVKYRCSYNTSHCTVTLQNLGNNRYSIDIRWDD